jgi:hypothetical protein
MKNVTRKNKSRSLLVDLHHIYCIHSYRFNLFHVNLVPCQMPTSFSAYLICCALFIFSVSARRIVPSNRELFKNNTLGPAHLGEEQINHRRVLSGVEQKVRGLPGLVATDIAHYAGYLNLKDGALFYWLFESKVPDAPLLVWLNGGPVRRPCWRMNFYLIFVSV